MYNDEEGIFLKDDEIPVLVGSGYYIKDVFLLDLDQDGHLDAVIVGTKGNNRYELRFVFNSEGKFDSDTTLHKSIEVFKHVPHPFQIFDDEDGLLKNFLLTQVAEESRKVISFTVEREMVL